MYVHSGGLNNNLCLSLPLFSEARRQIVCQCLAVVRAASKSWSMLVNLSKDAAVKARAIRPKDHVSSGARHSTLAASYMSMVTQQQEQQAAAAHAQAAAALEAPTEETEEAIAAEESNAQGSSTDLTDKSVPSSSSTGVAVGVPSVSRSLAVSDMEKAVQSAHLTKLAREAEDVERQRLETEESRYQASILFRQTQLENDANHGRSGESPYIHLQEESKLAPNTPLRVGLIGCGSVGVQIAQAILEQMCGLTTEKRDGTKAPIPSVPTTANGIRLFISTRRPDSPAIAKLVRRTGGSIGSTGTHGSGGLLTVYYDNARLLTECNVILLCVLPHQLSIVASTLRSLSHPLKPRSQLFFSITSSHTLKSLKTLLAVNTSTTTATSSAFGAAATTSNSTAPSATGLCIARTSIVLPHLMMKDSDGSRDLYHQFTHGLISSLSRSLTSHASFKSLLDSSTIEQVVRGQKRQVEKEVEGCFCIQETTSNSRMTNINGNTTEYTNNNINSHHLANSSFSFSSSTSSALTSPVHRHSSSSSSHPPSVTSPVSLIHGRDRSTAAGVGLTPTQYNATPATMTLPKLKELHIRTEESKSRSDLNHALASSTAAVTPQLQAGRMAPSATIQNSQHHAARPTHSQPVSTFHAQDRAKLYHQKFQ